MPDPNCPICSGTGFRIVERGGLTGAAACECSKSNQSGRLREKSNIPPNYEHATLDSFKLPEDNPTARTGLATVLMQARKFVREFPADDRPGLLFVGDPGEGKTHLTIGIMKALMEKGHECVFFDYQDLILRVQKGWDNFAGGSDREAYRMALDCEVLILDDLGAQRTIEWVQDTLESIITYRCNHRKPLIATTNLPDEDITGSTVSFTGKGGDKVHKKTLTEVIGMRARSRLFEMCRVIWMPAVQDFRVKTNDKIR
jgi:DNA replication protein DnaC